MLTREQEMLEIAVRDNKAAVRNVYERLGILMETAETTAEIGKHSRMRLAVYAIASVRWGAGWQRD